MGLIIIHYMEVLDQTAAAILQEPVKIVFTVPATGYKKILKWLRLYNEERVFYMKPISIGTSMRISREILKIAPEPVSQEEWLKMCFSSFDRYASIIANIVALALTNTKQAPTESFKDLLLENLTSKEVDLIFKAVVKQMDIQNFMTSIISIKGITILKEMSPMDQRGQIASGEQWEAL